MPLALCRKKKGYKPQENKSALTVVVFLLLFLLRGVATFSSRRKTESMTSQTKYGEGLQKCKEIRAGTECQQTQKEKPS